MGRKKIQISRICDERNRQVTFTKRKFGLMKKAYELSVLCDCEIALIIFNSANRLFQYASTDMDKVLLKYTEYNEPHESRTNKEIVEALNKKESQGKEADSLEDSNPEDFALTPRTQMRYEQINQDYEKLMQSSKPPGGARLSPYQNVMPVAVPSHSPGPFGSTSNASHGAPRSPSHQLSAAAAAVGQSHSPRHNPSPSMLDVGTEYHRGGASPGEFHRGPSPGALSPGGQRSLPPRSPQPLPPSATAAAIVQQQQRASASGHPNLRVVIPTSRGDLPPNAADQGLSRLNSNLATPVVSLSTPSGPSMSYPPTALANSFLAPGDFALTSAELQGMAVGCITSGLVPNGWNSQGPLSAAVQAAGIRNHSPLGSPASSLGMPPGAQPTGGGGVKSEPLSPGGGSGGPSNGGGGSSRVTAGAAAGGVSVQSGSAGHQLRQPQPSHTAHMSPRRHHNDPPPAPLGSDYDMATKRQRMDAGWNPA